MGTAAVVEGIEIVGSLLIEAKRQGLLKRLKVALQTKPRVLLLGCTGTGKTNFLDSLATPHPGAIRREDRTMWTEARNLLVSGKAFRFVDTVGDELRKDDRIQAIREAIAAKGGVSGILNLVCYGYHEYDVERKRVFTSDDLVNPHTSHVTGKQRSASFRNGISCSVTKLPQSG